MDASRRRSIKAVDEKYKQQAWRHRCYPATSSINCPHTGWHSTSGLLSQLRDDCRNIGRQHRQKLLQQQRSTLSPRELQVRATNYTADSVAACAAQFAGAFPVGQCLQAKLRECTMDAIREELKHTSHEGGHNSSEGPSAGACQTRWHDSSKRIPRARGCHHCLLSERNAMFAIYPYWHC